MLHDAHVRSYRSSERWRFVCECRYVAGLDRLARDAYFKEVAKHRPSHIQRLSDGADWIRRKRGW